MVAREPVSCVQRCRTSGQARKQAMSAATAICHPGFNRMFQPEKMTIGMLLPMAPLVNGVPDMVGQLNLAVQADRPSFAAL